MRREKELDGKKWKGNAYFKAAKGAVDRIKHQHGQRDQLGRTIPPIGAVHENGSAMILDLVGDLHRSLARNSSYMLWD